MTITRRKLIKSILAAPFGVFAGTAAETTANVFPKICAACRYYVPPSEPHDGMLIDGPVDSYCRHPEKMHGFYPCDETVRNLGLHREPGDTCRRYEKIVFKTSGTGG